VQPDESQWTTGPTSYERVQRRVFGLAPSGLVAVAALLTLAAAIVGFATGDAVIGVLLLVAAVLLAALFVEQARRHRESSLDRIAAAAADHARALAGFTGASVRTWSGAGREVARLRLEAHRLARERTQLQYALGEAAYYEDQERLDWLRAEMRRRVDRIDACVRDAHATVARARSRTADERLAVSATQVRRPGA
jgi:hypothetical protein